MGSFFHDAEIIAVGYSNVLGDVTFTTNRGNEVTINDMLVTDYDIYLLDDADRIEVVLLATDGDMMYPDESNGSNLYGSFVSSPDFMSDMEFLYETSGFSLGIGRNGINIVCPGMNMVATSWHRNSNGMIDAVRFVFAYSVY